MDRITDKMLDSLCARINKLTHSPETSYTRKPEGGMRANIGNFHISHAYGGVCLHRMCNEGGGVTAPLGLGHVTKRELWDRMQAFANGLEFKTLRESH